jgi:hypothetical protein
MVKQQLRDFEAQLQKKENQFQVSTAAVSKAHADDCAF